MKEFYFLYSDSLRLATFKPIVCFSNFKVQLVIIEKDSWLSSLTTRSSNTASLDLVVGTNHQPKVLLFDNLVRRLNNQLSFSRTTHCAFKATSHVSLGLKPHFPSLCQCNLGCLGTCKNISCSPSSGLKYLKTNANEFSQLKDFSWNLKLLKVLQFSGMKVAKKWFSVTNWIVLF